MAAFHPSTFHPSGVITLTTDFGLADPFVGVMKGRILSRFSGARIVDLTHAVPAHEPRVAGFWLSRCFEYFPPGTVHVAVVDPGVGTDRGIVCLLALGHALLAPDNGLLELSRARDPDSQVVRLSPATLPELGIHRVSSTFHGRDIFAPVAAELAAGRCSPEALGASVPSLAMVPADERRREGDKRPREDEAGPIKGGAAPISGSVVTIDHFGNLITDIDAAQLKRVRRPRVRIAGRTLHVRRTYGEARRGDLLALVNSFDVLEVAQAEGNAAAELAAESGTAVVVEEGAEDLLGGANRL